MHPSRSDELTHLRGRAAIPSLLLAMLLTPIAGCGFDDADLVPPTVTEDPSLPALDLNGTRFRFETAGDPADPVILFLHGGPGGNYESFRAYLDLADDGYYVVLWDQRGAGLSQRHDCDDVGVDQYLSDIEAMADYLTAENDNPLFLVGHSWGAMYATMYIDAHPDRVRSAVLSEPGGFTRKEVDDYFSDYLEIDVLDEGLNDVLWRQQFLTADDHARADYLLIASSYDAPNRVGLDRDHPEPEVRLGGVVSTCLPTSVDDFDWTTNLDQFPGQVLFLQSELNQVLTSERWQRIAGHYPDFEMVMLSGVGHDLMYQRSDEVKEHIRAHFGRYRQPLAAQADRAPHLD
ncbi:alpha/beta fold hydrolase [Haliangium sp.]|uniref:alpha/beta fold hydrolase n=1 Tax=Haliangium sp. TaxID=2663208 RepID=UPI003D0F34A0